MKQKTRKLMIKFSYSEDSYLYERTEDGSQRFLAKLNDLITISNKLNITQKEAFELILDLVKKRKERTSKPLMREKMELILFDPYLYFGDS